MYIVIKPKVWFYKALITLLILCFYFTNSKTAYMRLFSCIDIGFQKLSSRNTIREFSCTMSGRGRPRGAHRSTPASLNPQEVQIRNNKTQHRMTNEWTSNLSDLGRVQVLVLLAYRRSQQCWHPPRSRMPNTTDSAVRIRRIRDFFRWKKTKYWLNIFILN